jgi:hypothetical protein
LRLTSVYTILEFPVLTVFPVPILLPVARISIGEQKTATGKLENDVNLANEVYASFPPPKRPFKGVPVDLSVYAERAFPTFCRGPIFCLLPLLFFCGFSLFLLPSSLPLFSSPYNPTFLFTHISTKVHSNGIFETRYDRLHKCYALYLPSTLS